MRQASTRDAPSLLAALFTMALSPICGHAEVDELMVFPDRLSTYILQGGYDSSTDSVKDRCVTGSSTTDSPSAGLSSATVYSEVIQTKAQLLSKVAGSTDLAFKAFKFGSDGASSLEINDYSVYVLLQFQADKGKTQLQDIRLTETAKSLLAKDPKDFRRQCGNYVFIAEFGGGFFYGLLEVSTSSKNEQNDAKTALGGLFNGVSFNDTKKQEFKKLLENKRSRLWIVQSGGTTVPVFSASVEDFTVKVEAATTGIVTSPNPRAAYKLWPYTKILDFTAETLPLLSEEWLNNREMAINSFYGADKQYRNMRYVVEHPQQFATHDKDALQSQEKALRDELGKLTVYIEACASDIKKCSAKPPPVIVDFALPERLDGATDSCTLKRSTVCGVESYALARSASCGVENYVSKRDPLCQVETYEIGRTPVCGGERYKSGPCIFYHKWGHALPTTHPSYQAPTSTPCASGQPSIRAVEYETSGRFPRTVLDKWQGLCDGQVVVEAKAQGEGSDLTIGRCENAIFGVELWKECRDISHGTIYNICRLPAFGVESYKECRHKDNGVDRYAECLVQLTDAGKEVPCDVHEFRKLVPTWTLPPGTLPTATQ